MDCFDYSKCKVVYYAFLLLKVSVFQRLLSAIPSLDRRIRKIENMCHCQIKIDNIEREKCKQVLDVYHLVEVYYNDVNGNHSGCLNMFKELLKDYGNFQTIITINKSKDGHIYRRNYLTESVNYQLFHQSKICNSYIEKPIIKVTKPIMKATKPIMKVDKPIINEDILIVKEEKRIPSIPQESYNSLPQNIPIISETLEEKVSFSPVPITKEPIISEMNGDQLLQHYTLSKSIISDNKTDSVSVKDYNREERSVNETSKIEALIETIINVSQWKIGTMQIASSELEISENIKTDISEDINMSTIQTNTPPKVDFDDEYVSAISNSSPNLRSTSTIFDDAISHSSENDIVTRYEGCSEITTILEVLDYEGSLDTNIINIFIDHISNEYFDQIKSVMKMDLLNIINVIKFEAIQYSQFLSDEVTVRIVGTTGKLVRLEEQDLWDELINSYVKIFNGSLWKWIKTSSELSMRHEESHRYSMETLFDEMFPKVNSHRSQLKTVQSNSANSNSEYHSTRESNIKTGNRIYSIEKFVHKNSSLFEFNSPINLQQNSSNYNIPINHNENLRSKNIGKTHHHKPISLIPYYFQNKSSKKQRFLKRFILNGHKIGKPSVRRINNQFRIRHRLLLANTSFESFQGRKSSNFRDNSNSYNKIHLKPIFFDNISEILANIIDNQIKEMSILMILNEWENNYDIVSDSTSFSEVYNLILKDNFYNNWAKNIGWTVGVAQIEDYFLELLNEIILSTIQIYSLYILSNENVLQHFLEELIIDSVAKLSVNRSRFPQSHAISSSIMKMYNKLSLKLNEPSRKTFADEEGFEGFLIHYCEAFSKPLIPLNPIFNIILSNLRTVIQEKKFEIFIGLPYRTIKLFRNINPVKLEILKNYHRKWKATYWILMGGGFELYPGISYSLVRDITEQIILDLMKDHCYFLYLHQLIKKNTKPILNYIIYILSFDDGQFINNHLACRNYNKLNKLILQMFFWKTPGFQLKNLKSNCFTIFKRSTMHSKNNQTENGYYSEICKRKTLKIYDDIIIANQKLNNLLSYSENESYFSMNEYISDEWRFSEQDVFEELYKDNNKSGISIFINQSNNDILRRNDPVSFGKKYEQGTEYSLQYPNHAIEMNLSAIKYYQSIQMNAFNTKPGGKNPKYFGFKNDLNNGIIDKILTGDSFDTKPEVQLLNPNVSLFKTIEKKLKNKLKIINKERKISLDKTGDNLRDSQKNKFYMNIQMDKEFYVNYGQIKVRKKKYSADICLKENSKSVIFNSLQIWNHPDAVRPINNMQLICPEKFPIHPSLIIKTPIIQSHAGESFSILMYNLKLKPIDLIRKRSCDEQIFRLPLLNEVSLLPTKDLGFSPESSIYSLSDIEGFQYVGLYNLNYLFNRFIVPNLHYTPQCRFQMKSISAYFINSQNLFNSQRNNDKTLENLDFDISSSSTNISRSLESFSRSPLETFHEDAIHLEGYSLMSTAHEIKLETVEIIRTNWENCTKLSTFIMSAPIKVPIHFQDLNHDISEKSLGMKKYQKILHNMSLDAIHVRVEVNLYHISSMVCITLDIENMVEELYFQIYQEVVTNLSECCGKHNRIFHLNGCVYNYDTEINAFVLN